MTTTPTRVAHLDFSTVASTYKVLDLIQLPTRNDGSRDLPCLYSVGVTELPLKLLADRHVLVPIRSRLSNHIRLSRSRKQVGASAPPLFMHSIMYHSECIVAPKAP